jgi:hypothetical protein
MGDVNNKGLLLISPQPIVPAIEAHDGIIEVYRCLSIEFASKTDVNI